MKISMYQVDAFAEELFKGNPAAVCILESWLGDEMLQNIAAENNLSETAFCVPNDDVYELRWFTPNGEIDLCGHATLASAYIIFEYVGYTGKEIKFKTKSGILKVIKEGEQLSMMFPSREGTSIQIIEELVEALGKRPKELYKSRDLMAVFESEEEIRNMTPNMELIKQLDTFGIIVTARGQESDFVSRFFAPKANVPEDPVTGSAHCTLIPYWSKRLNKKSLKAQQLSHRGGILYCEEMGERVKISGKAVLFFKGEICL